VELLVVIAIIAVLMAILLPALGIVREKARLAACMSNMEQIYRSMATFANENDGRCPSAAVGRGMNPGILVPLYVNGNYLDNPEVCHCPSDEHFWRKEADVIRRQSYSYYYENGLSKVRLGGPYIDMHVGGGHLRTKRPDVVKLVHDGEPWISRDADYGWHANVPVGYRRHCNSKRENTLYHTGHVTTRDTHWPDTQKGLNWYVAPTNWGLLPSEWP
jgi:hypothetical protein